MDLMFLLLLIGFPFILISPLYLTNVFIIVYIYIYIYIVTLLKCVPVPLRYLAILLPCFPVTHEATVLFLKPAIYCYKTLLTSPLLNNRSPHQTVFLDRKSTRLNSSHVAI